MLYYCKGLTVKIIQDRYLYVQMSGFITFDSVLFFHQFTAGITDDIL